MNGEREAMTNDYLPEEEPPCTCTFYGPEPECPYHGECSYAGHPTPAGEEYCYCGLYYDLGVEP